MSYFVILCVLFFIWSGGVGAVTTQTRSGILDTGCMFVVWLVGTFAIFISFTIIMVNFVKPC